MEVYQIQTLSICSTVNMAVDLVEIRQDWFVSHLLRADTFCSSRHGILNSGISGADASRMISSSLFLG